MPPATKKNLPSDPLDDMLDGTKPTIFFSDSLRDVIEGLDAAVESQVGLNIGCKIDIGESTLSGVLTETSFSAVKRSVKLLMASHEAWQLLGSLDEIDAVHIGEMPVLTDELRTRSVKISPVDGSSLCRVTIKISKF